MIMHQPKRTNGADRRSDHSSRSSSHLFLFFNSEFRDAAANAHTISDPLFSDLVRETALLGSHGDPLSGSARSIEA